MNAGLDEPVLQYEEMPSKGGRPRGRFDMMVERTRRLVAGLADHTLCNASDAFLAKRLGVSPRSVRRYLLALKQRGLLARTTVTFQKQGRWLKRRLMKTGEKANEGFGMTRDEVLAFRQKRPAPKKVAERKQPTVTWREPVKLAYFHPPLYQEPPEGFGVPFHEDMYFGDRPCDAIELPETELEARLAKARAMWEAPDTHDPEYTKLSCRYIRANIARATRNGGVYPLGVLKDES